MEEEGLRPYESVAQATVTASGIARMAGVGRAAVSNWRRRHSDFPLPVGGTVASPVFETDAVARWLAQQGKLRDASMEEQLWRHIESFSPAAQIGDALCIAGAYMLTRSWRAGNGQRRSPRSGGKLLTPQQLLTQLRSRHVSLAELVSEVLPSEWSARIEAILQAAAQFPDDHDYGAAFEYLHAQYVTSNRSLAGPDSTPDAVAEMMLDLAGAGTQIFDCTSGTGSILRVAAVRALESGSRFACHAQEVNPRYALATMLRLWFVYERAIGEGLAAEAPCVQIGDSLLDDRFQELRADVVVANPPFGIHDWGQERLAYDPRWTFGLPPRTEPELAWVQHALSHLAQGKTAVLLMPPAAATRPAGRRIRGELVRRGALQAVVALPAGMLSPAAIGLHLWVLRNPGPASSTSPQLLFVDSAAALAPHKSQSLSDATAVAVREIVARAWRAFQSGAKNAEGEAGVYRIVPAVDVLDDAIDLTPRRYLTISGRPTVDWEETLAKARKFGDVVDSIRGNLPKVRVAKSSPLTAASTADVADLIRSGSLTVHRTSTRGRTTEPTTERLIEVKVLTGQDVVSGGPPTGTATVPSSRDSATLVEAGDILVPVIARQVLARVATADQVGAELGTGVQAVRVDPEMFDPWFLAGALSSPDNARVAGRASTTAGMLRIDVMRLKVPVVSIEAQRGYGKAFRQLVEFQNALDEAVSQGNDLACVIADGLSSGDLVIESG